MLKPKLYLVVGLLFLAQISLHGQGAIGAHSPAPIVNLTSDNESVSLAKGYVRAFQTMPAGPKFLYIRSEDGIVPLAGSVDALEAFDSVLFIQINSGPFFAINAKDVVRITNKKP